MQSFMPEYEKSRTYLELLADLPWSKETADKIDIRKARYGAQTPLKMSISNVFVQGWISKPIITDWRK